MQVAGEDLRLKFTKAHYGPYADDLRKVLSHIDGHFIDGFADGEKSNKPEAELKVLANAVTDAEKFLATDSATQVRFARTAKLIEGFETPFGMELLSTVHWVMTENPLAATDVSIATECVHVWNDRKRSLFAAEHIQLAWNRLKQLAWA